MVKDLPPRPVNEANYETAERVMERHVGCFASLPAPNGLCDGFGWPGMRIMHCCSGNALRSIYYLWDHILKFEQGTVKVNLLLNRASPWVDMDSHVPYEGRVDLHIKSDCRLLLRIPEWVKANETRCELNGLSHLLSWEGRYARVGQVEPGDVVVMTFPIAERTLKQTIMGIDLEMVIKGNDVVKMDPPGEYYPFYQQRSHYRQGKPRWVSRDRFLSTYGLAWR
jgi:hypothetical protein